MTRAGNLKKKSYHLTFLHVLAALGMVVTVVLVSLGIINRILLRVPMRLRMPRYDAFWDVESTEGSHGFPTRVMAQVDGDLVNVTSPLLTPSTCTTSTQSPTSTSTKVTAACTDISLISKTTPLFVLAGTPAVPANHISSTAANVNSTPLSALPNIINLQLFPTSAPPPTPTDPSFAVYISPYSPTVATSVHTYDVPSRVYYDTWAVAVTLMTAIILMGFIAWAIVQFLLIDLPGYCREWLRESLRTLRGRDRSDKVKVFYTRTSATVRLLDRNLNPVPPNSQQSSQQKLEPKHSQHTTEKQGSLL